MSSTVIYFQGHTINEVVAMYGRAKQSTSGCQVWPQEPVTNHYLATLVRYYTIYRYKESHSFGHLELIMCKNKFSINFHPKNIVRFPKYHTLRMYQHNNHNSMFSCRNHHLKTIFMPKASPFLPVQSKHGF